MSTSERGTSDQPTNGSHHKKRLEATARML